MKEKFIDHRFNTESLALIGLANEIITEYAGQGFDLTLRQLYYQLVARDLIVNTTRSYKRLGNLISNARLAGLIDWAAIVDRTRALRKRSHWTDPEEIIRGAEQSYHIDMWEHQEHRPEVWIEKDALTGVIAGVCNDLDTPFFACRGYVSLSEMHTASQRIVDHMVGDQEPDPETGMIVPEHVPIIFHLGDHDPSGIDMTRDIIARLELLSRTENEGHFLVKRLALNWDQVQQYGPPPNPTKLSDSRASGYVEVHGYSSWELDALEPQVIVALIRENIERLIDKEQWAKDEQRKAKAKAELRIIRENYDDIMEDWGSEEMNQ